MHIWNCTCKLKLRLDDPELYVFVWTLEQVASAHTFSAVSAPENAGKCEGQTHTHVD